MKNLLTRTAASGAITVLAASGLVAVTAQPAAACPVVPFYSLSSTTTRIGFPGGGPFRSGPGGTMRVSRNFTSTVSYTITAGGSTEVDAVFAKAKAEVSGSITKTNSSSVTVDYIRNITPRKFGNVQWVTYGYRVNWRKQQFVDSTCRAIRTVSLGTINFPTAAEGWYYWETAS